MWHLSKSYLVLFIVAKAEAQQELYPNDSSRNQKQNKTHADSKFCRKLKILASAFCKLRRFFCCVECVETLRTDSKRVHLSGKGKGTLFKSVCGFVCSYVGLVEANFHRTTPCLWVPVNFSNSINQSIDLLNTPEVLFSNSSPLIFRNPYGVADRGVYSQEKHLKFC